MDLCELRYIASSRLARTTPRICFTKLKKGGVGEKCLDRAFDTLGINLRIETVNGKLFCQENREGGKLLQI